MRKEILVATGNKHKIREIAQILKGLRATGCGVRVRENGKTFEANAIKKARAGAKKFGKLTIADDSGLMVNALNGRPGVRSARFAGPNPTPEKLCTKLLRVMKNKKNRAAKFVCCIAIVGPDGKTKTVKGQVKGRIIHEMRGTHGFGYDSVFVPTGYKKTFAEMNPKMKNRLSHRSRALHKASLILKRLYSKI